jgi:diguanylate cyclase (GGDEF)-like protein/PAS domain S-box-containing protein
MNEICRPMVAALAGAPGVDPSATRTPGAKSSGDPDPAGPPVPAGRDAGIAHRLESDRFLLHMLDNVQLLAVTLDARGRIGFCNDYLLQLTGWTREEVLGQDWTALFLPPGAQAQPGLEARRAGRSDAWHHENQIVTRGGERRTIRWSNTVLRADDGEAIGTASIGEDITDRQRAEARIHRLNRVYAVLSGINTLIVHATGRDQLFADACRIAVEQGRFKGALIGLVDASTRQVRAVATAGVRPDFLAAARARLSLSQDTPEGVGIAAEALATHRPVVVNHVRADARIAHKDACLAQGVEALVVLPLVVADTAVGVLALLAAEPGSFDEDEMALLAELTGDIAFAMDHIDKSERLNYLAYYDVLTGLANRDLFLERVAQFARRATADAHKLAVVIIDLERFRNINESLGQPGGDALLRQVADWFVAEWGDASLLARVDADHFAAVVPQVADGGEVARRLEKTMDALVARSFRVGDAELCVAARAGVALFPDDGEAVDVLFKHAEAALKKAKAGDDRYLFYAQKMTEAVAGKLLLENQLRRALDHGEFVLHYQPKVDLADGRVVGAEARIRWNDPRSGLVPPGQFIPILEETGLICAVGRWAMQQAVDDHLRWRRAGLPAVRVAVNVSGLQLRHRGFLAEVGQVLGTHPQASAGLELEITENAIMDDVQRSIATLQAIRAMGAAIAIDDFGTGFSSLGCLARLPVDALKIDRSFVAEMTLTPEGLSLVSTIINLAHSLRLKVVAEGVETDEQARLLQLLKCDQMQGFVTSRPVPAAEFAARFLKS